MKSGDIHVDFRPLLMTLDEVTHALENNPLGTLSTENPRVEGPDGSFCLELRQSKSKRRSNRDTWICYHHESGGRWPDFGFYEGPIRLAIGKNGRVLVEESKCLYMTYDVETTQVLNRYYRDAEDDA